MPDYITLNQLIKVLREKQQELIKKVQRHLEVWEFSEAHAHIDSIKELHEVWLKAYPLAKKGEIRPIVRGKNNVDKQRKV